jgi:hypothetical protein
MILVYLGRWSYGRFKDDNNIFYKMKNDLTTGTWQDDIWCPIIIILLCTSDGIHSLYVGWRNFFSKCAVVLVLWLWWEIAFWFWWEIVSGVTYDNGVQYRVVVLCVFFVLAGNSFWCYLLYVLWVQYSCAVVSVFWLWQEMCLFLVFNRSTATQSRPFLKIWRAVRASRN